MCLLDVSPRQASSWDEIMLITINDEHSQEEVRDAIYMAFLHTRFNVGEITTMGKRRVRVAQVRLKERKRYCGNHPNACEVEAGRMGTYLEGLDWVEFNDRLNDALDVIYVDAWVRSTYVKVNIRQGELRRVNYTSHYLGRDWAWDETGSENDYEFHCGRIAPASTYPPGTPGTYEREVASCGVLTSAPSS